MTEEKAKILAKTAEITAMDAFRVSTVVGKTPALTESKFGGVPYWDKTMAYPLSSRDEKMALLAQINFAELPENEIFPKEGMLQFFVALDDVYGAEFSTPDIQKDFRVIYHKTIDTSVTAESLADLQIPTHADGEDLGFPITREMALSFEKTKISMGVTDYRYMEKVKEAAKLVGEAVPEADDPYDYLKGSEYDKETKNTGHWMLGYPFFTQYDPRENNEALRRFDTVLLQIDSEYSKEHPDYEIMWGDAGVANFFINGDALRKGDFSEIMYSWDCG
ncbi:MAG: DUF1963 domain-containing protein [Lachnospiraceae bacterium]|nr:DUF1963 domain-containing protein [Lachnospiraceae bacterium]